MDGTTTNFSCMKIFGCKLGNKLEDIDGSFNYDGYSYTIYFNPDPPHMLKLARNALHDYQIFVDEDEKLVCWKHSSFSDAEGTVKFIRRGEKLSF